MMDKNYRLNLSISQKDGKRVLALVYNLGSLTHLEKQVSLASGPVELKVSGTPDDYTFSYRQGTAAFIKLGTIATKFLSSEFVGGFTGVYIGMFAEGKDTNSKDIANFDWFQYQPR